MMIVGTPIHNRADSEPLTVVFGFGTGRRPTLYCLDGGLSCRSVHEFYERFRREQVLFYVLAFDEVVQLLEVGFHVLRVSVLY